MALKTSGKQIVTIAFIVIDLIVMLGSTYFIYTQTKGRVYHSVTEKEEFKKLEEERVFKEDEPILFTMDPFIINLNGFPKRVIRMTVNLEMLDEDGFEEVITLGSKARDVIVQLINSKNYQDIASIQGKLLLKDEIALNLNQSLKSGVIRDVYFSDFVVQ